MSNEQPNEQNEPDLETTDDISSAEANNEVAESAGGEATDPESEVAQLQAELSEAREQALRAQAEMHNVRRRAEQDVEKAHKFGQEKLITEMLTVVDNLERALAAAEGDGEAYKAIKEGVELTLKALLDALKRHNVEPVNPVGEPFDPQLHQAMSMVESPDAEPNTVLEVFQKGYTLHGRLVRPAMVVVSKAPAN